MASGKKALPQPTTAGLPATTSDEGHGLPPKPSSGLKRTRSSATSDSVPSEGISPQHLPPRPRRSWTRRSASWTNEEDEKLVQLVKKETAVPPSITASKTWSRVAAQLKNRTGKQCRERYLNQLRPGIRRDPWSVEEERILHEVHAKIGNKWVAIAEQLPGRTDNCVKNHWNSMLRKRQRREAALQSAQKNLSAAASKSDEVVQPQTPTTTPSVASLSPTSPGVPSSLSSPLFGVEIDRNSDADFSSRTGCATPSGLSSILDVGSSSGIPSPFTASSPITPKRDVKLQISSLVVAQNSDASNHGEGYFTKDELTCGSVLPAVHGNGDSHGKPDETLPSIAGDTRTVGSEQHLGQPVSSSDAAKNQLPQVLVSLQSGQTTNTVGSRPLRRSSRLTPGVEKTDASEANTSTPEITRQRRPVVQNMRRLSEGMGNPLAALAIAASSVPPSPLTPDSRFSATSPSPISPASRAKQSTSKRAKRSASNITEPEAADKAGERTGLELGVCVSADGVPTRKSRRLEKNAPSTPYPPISGGQLAEKRDVLEN